MKVTLTHFVLLGIFAGCVHAAEPELPKPILSEARKGFVTKLVRKEQIGEPLIRPDKDFISLVHYSSPAGELGAYLCKPPSKAVKRPAMIWLVGGFSSSISPIVWTPSLPYNDQSGSTFWRNGILTLYPSYRGGNDNPGHFENFYGEVDDVLAAAKYLSTMPDVDPDRIYLGGHSTGGTLALLVAETGAKFRSVFAFGPSDDVLGYGDEILVFDTKDPKEGWLRAPIRWMHGIVSPTFVFEGADGRSNVESLNRLIRAPHPKTVSFYPVAGADHFKLLRPVSELITWKILSDKGPSSSIAITPEEIQVTLKK